MRDFVLFVNGRYQKRHSAFYKALCRGRTRVAVDGGYRFLCKIDVVPDILIGDFDSVRIPRHLPSRTEVVTFPVRKDKTDLHLALDLCLERSARRIDIVVPNVGEIDHFVGNLMLLTYFTGKKSKKIALRIVNPEYEVLPAANQRITVTGCAGDLVSILPVSGSIRLTTTGLEYPARDRRVPMGHSVSLRNAMTGKRATVLVKGRALIVHRFPHLKPARR